MTPPVLYIGNKNYSSWSFRAWIGLRAAGIEFTENLQRFDMENRNRHFREFSPTGKVPVLVDGDLTVWESLAILEYAADRYPDRGLWPEDLSRRAVARAAAHEMHAGFPSLRAACPFNIRRIPQALAVTDSVREDVRRIESLWSECLSDSGGPFLFGRFGIADAMYAPVVNRLRIYELSDSEVVRRYSAAMTGHDAWREWERAAVEEPWVVEEDEV